MVVVEVVVVLGPAVVDVGAAVLVVVVSICAERGTGASRQSGAVAAS